MAATSGNFGASIADDLAQLGAGRGRRRVGRRSCGSQRRPSRRRLRDPGEDVAHEVDPAALPGRAGEHPGDRRPSARGGGRRSRAAPRRGPGPAGRGGTRSRTPRLAVADLDAEDLTVTGCGDTGGDDDRPGDDPVVDPALDVGRVERTRRGTRRGRAGGAERRRRSLSRLGADPRHLGLRDPRPDTQRGDQVVDLAGRHPVDPRLHHDRAQQGLVDPGGAARAATGRTTRSGASGSAARHRRPGSTGTAAGCRCAGSSGSRSARAGRRRSLR